MRLKSQQTQTHCKSDATLSHLRLERETGDNEDDHVDAIRNTPLSLNITAGLPHLVVKKCVIRVVVARWVQGVKLEEKKGESQQNVESNQKQTHTEGVSKARTMATTAKHRK